MCYGIAANCDIAKEEAADLIRAISQWERAAIAWHYETDTMSDEAKENLIQAAARQGEMNILVYGLKFNKSAIRQRIVDYEGGKKK